MEATSQKAAVVLSLLTINYALDLNQAFLRTDQTPLRLHVSLHMFQTWKFCWAPGNLKHFAMIYAFAPSLY